MLEGVTDEGVAQQMVQRMAELVVWNKYGWGATKEVFGFAEAQDVGVEGPNMGERIEKAKKIKEKEEKKKEKEKEGKGDKGSSGRPGSWSEGGSWRLAFQGSKVVVTLVESGDILQEVAPILPLKAQGGWEQDTEGVGSTENKDKGRDNRVRDNKDKDSMVKDWGLQSETKRGLGEGEKGEERKKGDKKRWREDQSGKKRELGENTEIKGRVRVEKGLEFIGRSKEMTQEEL
jgi:hypothetical protein